MAESLQQRFHILLMTAIVACVLLLPWHSAWSVQGETANPDDAFQIEDYFKVKRITELALSSDGEMVAYAVEQQSLEENKTKRVIYISAVEPGAEPVVIDEIQKGRSLAWVPGSEDLAFLMTLGGAKDASTQVFSINPQTEELTQHTSTDNGVTAFHFSSEGKTLAYVTRADADEGESPYDQFFNGNKGVVTDPETLIVYYFLNKDWRDWRVRPGHRLWIKRSQGAPVEIDLDGEVKSFHWSPDGTKLSVIFISDDLPENAASKRLTSVGLVDAKFGDVETVAKAVPAADGEKAVYYNGGEWLPGGERIHLRRLVQLNAWHSKADWTIVDAIAPDLPSADWHDIERGLEDTFIAAGSSTFYLKKTVNAVDGLYRLTANGLARADMIENLSGAAKFFSFSGDFKSAVFVSESLTSPPEIYRWEEGKGLQKISNINAAIDEKVSSHWREVVWTSKDGASVRGWLITPEDVEESGEPLPLLTFVHGGPGVPMRNEFAYMMFRNWPYPFLRLAEAGIAVFLPNYRGTRSFGFEHMRPQTLDGEPVDDIVAGVDHLIREDVADGARLAISGHSHGAWLAPMVMVRDRRYIAGSFAEGSQNAVINYSLMPMYLNRITHDVQRGPSLYDDPQLYIDHSPDLHFQGLETAMLFEAGVKSLSVSMIGSQKAARRAGLPAEYVVYPKTGHGLNIPRLQKESATRNLDWLRFWLQDYEDTDPKKADQYSRWREMRDEQCARLKGDDSPSYCRQAR